jgi:hypothetical protein
MSNNSSAISVNNLWQVFGPNPEKIVDSPDAACRVLNCEKRLAILPQFKTFLLTLLQVKYSLLWVFRVLVNQHWFAV